MKIKAAAVIHARTKNNDFPAELLVAPCDLSLPEIRWARKYISESTRYFELVGNKGRRVIFCNEQRIISGISIVIEDLYRICGKEPRYDKVDGTRTNYAFIGVAMNKEDITDAFQIPYEFFRGLYEEYMGQLWERACQEEASSVTRSSYEPVEFPDQIKKCNLPVIEEGAKLVIDTGYAPMEQIEAAVTDQMRSLAEYAFCSDLPNATSVSESRFRIVTSDNAEAIMETLKKNEAEKNKEEGKEAKKKKTAKDTGRPDMGRLIPGNSKEKFGAKKKKKEEEGAEVKAKIKGVLANMRKYAPAIGIAAVVVARQLIYFLLPEHDND